MKIVRIISVVMMVAVLQGCLLCSSPSYYEHAGRCIASNGLFLRDFYAKLKPVRQNKPAYVAKFSVMLNKGTHYRFILCDNYEYQDRAIFELRSDNGLLHTTHDSGTDNYNNYSFDFKCDTTAVYYVCLFSKEEWKHEQNHALVVLSFMGKE